MNVSAEQFHSSRIAECPAARVHLFGPLIDGWHVANPLPVAVEREEDGRVVFYDEIFNVYGTGGSWDVAERDYKVALVEFFEIIAAAQDPDSQRILSHLKAYIRRS